MLLLFLNCYILIALDRQAVSITICFIFITCSWRWFVFTFEASFDNLVERTDPFYFQFIQIAIKWIPSGCIIHNSGPDEWCYKPTSCFYRESYDLVGRFSNNNEFTNGRGKVILNHSFRVHSWYLNSETFLISVLPSLIRLWALAASGSPFKTIVCFLVFFLYYYTIFCENFFCNYHFTL